MNATTATFPVNNDDPRITVREAVPPFEGSNICSWIGFKHLMYLAEEAALQNFRQRGLEPARLYEERGLCLEVVDSSIHIAQAVHLGDRVRVEMTPKPDGGRSEYPLSTTMFVEKNGVWSKAATGKLTAVMMPDLAWPLSPPPVAAGAAREGPRPSCSAPPPALVTGRGALVYKPNILSTLGVQKNSLVWKWRIPYFYCHYMRRLQHSGYLRIMEEIVDLFLASRGISIRRLLETRRWIPVVPEARLQILSEVEIEEELYAVFTVETIYKEFFYSATLDCFVIRDGCALQTARGRIVHGYARILNRRDWELVAFDAEVISALRGGGSHTDEIPATQVLL